MAQLYPMELAPQLASYGMIVPLRCSCLSLEEKFCSEEVFFFCLRENYSQKYIETGNKRGKYENDVTRLETNRKGGLEFENRNELGRP